MAKIRVYELAKQLEIQSKDIIGYLADKGVEVKSQSNIEDKEIGMVQVKFGKKQAPKAEPKKETPKKEAKPEVKAETKVEAKTNASTEDKASHPKKKSSITAVFNAQYSKQPRRNDGNRNNGERNNNDRRQQGNRNNNGNRPAERIKPVRPIERPAGSRPSDRVKAEAEDVVMTQRPAERQNNRPNNNNNNSRPNNNSNRQDRPNNNRYNNGDRNNNNNYNNNNRPNYNRNNDNRNNDNRTFNRNDNRSNDNRGGDNRGNNNYRSNNNRPSNGYNNNNNGDNRRPNNNNGARPGFNNNRPGNNNGRPNNGARPGNNMSRGGNDQDQNRFNGVAKPTDSRPNDNRRSDNGRKNNRKNEHDALGSKRPERYVNLEKNGGKKRGKPQQPKQPERSADEILTITLPEHLTIKELADKMKVQPSAIVKKLFLTGQMVTVNSDVDFEEAEEIALEFNCVCEHEVKVDVIAELLKEDDELEENKVSRPPVVCVMGHVDHGKTSLLDAIRDTKVTDREAGGITQHIGAYMVSINGQKITFLDTPGHEAFTAMRMRGANSTDIAILVVAADDGVMPQTVEAINHAKAAGIEIIVAINKIDKPNANIERVKQELSEYELIPEDWGGSTIFVPVSAHTNEGIDTLLEMILLTAEVCELKADPNRNARGLVVEAQLDKGRGAVATVLVQKGTLHVGDPIAAGSSFGKVRAMIDDNGKRVKSAGPSTPVEILGLSDVPNAGEIFMSMDSEKEARGFAETFVSEGKNKLIEDTKAKMSLDDLFSQIQSGNLKELNIIVKADVQGSVEAVKQSLVKLSNDEVVVKIIHGGVGAINESDIILASASNAIVIGFNVRPDPTAKVTADQEGVDVRLYKVIYNAIEDVEAAMKGMLDPIFEEKIIGHAQVRQIFKSSDVGNIAGSYILDGMFQRGCKVRITREGEQIFEGDLASLKRFKDDVKEVKAGYECGLVFDGFDEIKEEDEVEAYIMVEVPR